MGYSPWGRKESDMTEAVKHTCTAGIKPTSAALQGGFLTTGPRGRPPAESFHPDVSGIAMTAGCSSLLVLGTHRDVVDPVPLSKPS